jgi:hypothetical protein
LLKFANEIVGKEGPIYLNTGIIEHNFANPTKRDVIKIGEKDKIIDLNDIIQALENIQNNMDFQKAFDSGRSYFFEGYNKNNNVSKKDYDYSFYWGS